MPTDREQVMRGVKRLMLKMPALRGQLQKVSAKSPEAQELCGAFDEASTTLERLRKERGDQSIIEEYEQICLELEKEVISFLEKELANN